MSPQSSGWKIKPRNELATPCDNLRGEGCFFRNFGLPPKGHENENDDEEVG
jgi:hypothetical protein